MVKSLLANAGDARDAGSIPESGRSPGKVNGIPLQYSCLENSMDRGARGTTVQGVAESQTWLSTQHTQGVQCSIWYIYIYIYIYRVSWFPQYIVNNYTTLSLLKLLMWVLLSDQTLSDLVQHCIQPHCIQPRFLWSHLTNGGVSVSLDEGCWDSGLYPDALCRLCISTSGGGQGPPGPCLWLWTGSSPLPHMTFPSLRDEARFPCIVSRAIAFSQSNT